MFWNGSLTTTKVEHPVYIARTPSPRIVCVMREKGFVVLKLEPFSCDRVFANSNGYST
jgi:hypothetical protein